LILLVKRNNLIFCALVLTLCLTILGVNLSYDKDAFEATTVSTVPVLSTAGKTVVIDAGHGGEDPGAVSKFNGVSEKDITLVIAQKTKELLEKAGYKVIMTRTEDVLNYNDENASMTAKRRQDLLKRKKIMDESNADIVVSIHLNSFPETKYRGAQTFYTKNSLSGKKLAGAIQESLKINVDPDNDREALQKKEDIIITKDCKVTTVIVECGFLSNETECVKLAEESYQTKLAEGIKTGIDKYFTAMVPEATDSKK